MNRFLNFIRWKAAAWPLILAFALGVCTLTYAAFQMRMLAFDGGDFSYHILTTGTFIRNPGYYRYLAILPEIPALLSVHLLGFGQMSISRMVLALTHSWLPVISALLAIALCFFYKKPQIALGPLATFGLISLPIAGLPYSVVAESVSFFWVSYLIQVYGRRSRAENTALAIICLTLSFGHETAALLTALMLLLAIAQKYWFAAGLRLLALAGYLLRIIALPKTRVNEVAASSLENFDPWALGVSVALISLLVAVISARGLSAQGRKWALRVNCFLGGAALLWILRSAYTLDIRATYNTLAWRMYATSFLALIAATLWTMDTQASKFHEKFDAPLNAGWWRYLYTLTLVGMLLGVWLDYTGTKIWQKEVATLRKYMAEQADATCVNIPFSAYRKKLKLRTIQSYNISHVWALLQKDGILDKFVFVSEEDSFYGPRKLICQHLSDDPFSIDAGFSRMPAAKFVINRKAFTYSFLQEL